MKIAIDVSKLTVDEKYQVSGEAYTNQVMHGRRYVFDGLFTHILHTFEELMILAGLTND